MRDNYVESSKNNDIKTDKEKDTKSKSMLCPIIVFIIMAIAGGFIIWRETTARNQKEADNTTITDLKQRVDKLENQSKSTDVSSKTENISSACNDIASASARENIIASITSGNTAALQGYMASSVRVVIAASGAAFDRTPAKAIEDIKYIESAEEPWNFSLDATVLQSYENGGYKDYFDANSIVGVSKDKKVIVFNFDCKGKIDQVFMSANSSLLTE